MNLLSRTNCVQLLEHTKSQLKQTETQLAAERTRCQEKCDEIMKLSLRLQSTKQKKRSQKETISKLQRDLEKQTLQQAGNLICS